MAHRRRRSPTKGRRCTRYKRVRVRGQGYARRCAKYGAKRSSYRKKRRSTRRRTTRRAAGMARRGSKCVRFKRVRVRGGGMQRRCAKYRAR
jgi:hypothetical protein